MSQHSLLKQQVADYYSGKIKIFGTTSRGVDWNSTESQWLRFDQLLGGFQIRQASLNDYGCGFGELLRYLKSKGFNGTYHGYDLSPEMIDAAGKLFGNEEPSPRSNFCLGDDMTVAEYSVASGLFNVRQQAKTQDWEQYIQDCLDKMRQASSKGFAFNMLTTYSDPPLQKEYLYYANPSAWFDYCKRTFSRNVALIHDYGLYEFTIRVRLDTE